jgi:cytochrome P450/ferredoxin-NADP reductase
MSNVELQTVDLMDAALFSDGPPHELFAQMRREAPVRWNQMADGDGFWSVTRAADIAAISKDSATFSSERRGVFVSETMPMPVEVLNQVLLGMDPPRHTKYREIVQKAFTPRIVAQQEAQIRARIDALLDDVCERGECDLVKEISIELPLQVIAEMLGVPQEDRGKLFDWTMQIEAATGDPEVDGTAALGQIGVYLADVVAARRASPADDLVTALISAEVDGDQLNDFEIAAFFALLMFAGNDTTRNTISGGTLALIEHPQERRKLIDDPSLIDGAVEEMLRWVTPVMWFRRTPTTDTELCGVPIKEGEKVVIWYASGSRDEQLVEDAMQFRVDRPAVEHQAFGGGGRHFCLGSSLARLELKHLFPELLRRLPDMQLAGPVGRTPSNWVNGITSLPVTFTPTPAQARAEVAPTRSRITVHEHEHELTITRREDAATGVVALTLADPAGEDLPESRPGSHIDVLLDDGAIVRQYSLCGTSSDAASWRIGVLRDPSSRGGSQRVHDELHAGTTVRVRGPRNHFALVSSPRYQFIAGGIGITPILAMIEAAEASGADWELLYGGRERSSMAFLDELSRYGDRVTVWPQDEQGMLDLDGVLGTPGEDTLVYCCGPEPLLNAVEERCAHWPPGSLRIERFAAKTISADEPSLGLASFEVVCQRSGVTVAVGPDTTIYDAVADAGVDVLASCMEGICATCECAVVDGTPDHRDSVLTDAEKEAGQRMMICVSRSQTERLVLDI